MYRGIFATGEYYHVYNRGNRKETIFYEEKDMWRFLQSLRFFNDSRSSLNLLRDLSLLTSDVNRLESVFESGWPKKLPEQKPLVKILCYSLLPNHFHLLVKEIINGGISKFMQKVGNGFSKYSNLKYQNVGRIFQGPYKIKLIKGQEYLEYLMVYIQVINVLELFPGGMKMALRGPKKATNFLNGYIFSSHPDYIGLRKSLIIDKDILGEIFLNPEKYKEFINQTLFGESFPFKTNNITSLLGDLILE